MTTEQIIHKAFDVYCISLYGKTFPYTENNLYKFLEEIYKDFRKGENLTYCKYIFKVLLPARIDSEFIEYLLNFIQQHDKQSNF